MLKEDVIPDPVEWVGHVGAGVLAIRSSGVAKYTTDSEHLSFPLLSLILNRADLEPTPRSSRQTLEIRRKR